MIITKDDFLLNCYLSLLEYEYNPQIEHNNIVFTYNALRIKMAKIGNKRGDHRLIRILNILSIA